MLLKWIQALQAQRDEQARRRGFDWAAGELLMGTSRERVRRQIDEGLSFDGPNPYDHGALDAYMRTHPQRAIVHVPSLATDVVVPLSKVRTWLKARSEQREAEPGVSAVIELKNCAVSGTILELLP